MIGEVVMGLRERMRRSCCWLLGHTAGRQDPFMGRLCGRCERPMYALEGGYRNLWQRIRRRRRQSRLVLVAGNHGTPVGSDGMTDAERRFSRKEGS